MSKSELNDYNSLFPDISNLVKPKNCLLNDIKFNKLVEFIINEVINIPDYRSFKNNLELIKLVCNLVENKIVKKDNVDKKKVVIHSFSQIFKLTDDEIKNLDGFIEFLHKNKKIKKLSVLKKYVLPSANFFLKLIL
jgi:transcription termination factor NusB